MLSDGELVANLDVIVSLSGLVLRARRHVRWVLCLGQNRISVLDDEHRAVMADRQA